MDIPIKQFDTELPLPKEEPGAACFDLVCRETVTIQPHAFGAVPQNVALQVPAGYALLLFVRSSTPKKTGLVMANGVGVLDPFYRGDNDEILAFLLNVTDQPVTVQKGDRIMQGMIIKTEPVTWNEVDQFGEDGHKGYQH